MSVELVPMLLLALLLMASDGSDAGTALLLLSGDHRLDDSRDTVIVADATVTIPAGTNVDAPVYVIGGSTRIDGTVTARVTQLSGSLIVGGDAEIAELRHIGGNRTVSGQASIARRTRVDLTTGERDPPLVSVPLLITVAMLSLVGARLARTRERNLDNLVHAVAHHPVVIVTVGTVLTLTLLSLFVFMAFTLVLIPVSIVGSLAGLAVTALGVVAWGHRLGRLLPLRSRAVATAAGVAGTVIGLQLVGGIPVIGDLVVAFVLLSGVGAVTVTYLGFTRFQPAALPD